MEISSWENHRASIELWSWETTPIRSTDERQVWQVSTCSSLQVPALPLKPLNNNLNHMRSIRILSKYESTHQNMLEYVWIINHNESLDIIIKHIQTYIYSHNSRKNHEIGTTKTTLTRYGAQKSGTLHCLQPASSPFLDASGLESESVYPWGMVGMVGMVGTGFTTFNMYGWGIGWVPKMVNYGKIHHFSWENHWISLVNELERSTMLLMLGKSM